jgi:uncharacterized protein YndB with AHSA1/START domain
MATPSIDETALLDAGCPDAFRLMTTDLGRWWPADYTWSGDALEDIRIDPRVGGRCLEVDTDGTERVWGTVTECEPGRRLAFSWQIDPDRSPQPDPERASVVRMSWEPAGEGCRVHLVHEEFDRHRGDAGAYHDGMASDRGWPLLLRRYAAACAGEGRD